MLNHWQTSWVSLLAKPRLTRLHSHVALAKVASLMFTSSLQFPKQGHVALSATSGLYSRLALLQKIALFYGNQSFGQDALEGCVHAGRD